MPTLRKTGTGSELSQNTDPDPESTKASGSWLEGELLPSDNAGIRYQYWGGRGGPVASNTGLNILCSHGRRFPWGQKPL